MNRYGLPAFTGRVFLWSLIVLTLFCDEATCHGQSTLNITFDGPPAQPPGTGAFVQQYYESNIWFRPLGIVGPGNGFVRQGGGFAPAPENGTAYLQAGLGNSLMFSFLNGSIFGLVSVELAEYSTTVPNPVVVPFVGCRQDGNMVMPSFTMDGIIDGTGPLVDFETFYFGPEFSDLVRVESPTYGWSLDNLVISVPEPRAIVLLIVGLFALRAWKRRG